MRRGAGAAAGAAGAPRLQAAGTERSVLPFGLDAEITQKAGEMA